MKKKILKALKHSINTKWKGIRYGGKEDRGRFDCELCGLFLNASPAWIRCEGCPVHERTSFALCRNTPYIDWSNHHSDVHGPNSAYVVYPGCDECESLADKQIAFLESLLPATTPSSQSMAECKGEQVNE